MPYYAFVIAGTVAQGLMFLFHWLLYNFLVRFFVVTNSGVLLTLKIIIGILSITFVAASILAARYDNLPVRILYDIAVFWLGLLLYFFIAALLTWLAVKIFGFFSVSLDTKAVAVVLFVLAILVSVWGTLNASFVRVKRLDIGLPNLPLQWQGKTALWISDIHLGAVRNYGFAVETATMIQDLHPDIIFLGGDIFDGVAADLDKLARPYAQLKASQGVYFITGNHEEFTADRLYQDAIKRAGIKELDNEMINLNGLHIIGVNYRDTSNATDYRKILKTFTIDPNQPSILLKHAPTDQPIAQAAGINLQLSGHAHCGQLWPVGIISNLIYKGYACGLNRAGDMTVYTSSGAGTWGPPMRVLTTPEIVLIRFYKN